MLETEKKKHFEFVKLQSTVRVCLIFAVTKRLDLQIFIQGRNSFPHTPLAFWFIHYEGPAHYTLCRILPQYEGIQTSVK